MTSEGCHRRSRPSVAPPGIAGYGVRLHRWPRRHCRPPGAGGVVRAMRVDPRAILPRHSGTALAEPLQRCSTTEQRRTQRPTRLPRQRLPQQRPAHTFVRVALLCLWPMSDAPTRRQRSPIDPTRLRRESDTATHRHNFRKSREGRRRLRGVGFGRQSRPLPQGSRTPVDSCHPNSVRDGCGALLGREHAGDALKPIKIRADRSSKVPPNNERVSPAE